MVVTHPSHKVLKEANERQNKEKISLTGQCKRYEQLLDETQGALTNQRSIVESLKEAVEQGPPPCGGGGEGLNLQTEKSLAEMDALVKVSHVGTQPNLFDTIRRRPNAYRKANFGIF